MKAYLHDQYGPPEVLKRQEVEVPVPADDEVLVKVAALSLNPAEWHLMSGEIWLVRATNGLSKPKQPILGADVAGIVSAVGKQVSSFTIGDRVFGRSFTGGMAAYACVKEDQLAVLPEQVSFEHAAATPLAALTALFAMRDKGQIKPGEKVLINGASGGIGTFAVQLAKHFGTEVTGVCSARNGALVQSLGATDVVDYTQYDFTKGEKQYDLLLDLIGNRTATDLSRVLRPDGRCVMVGFTSFKLMLNYILKGTWLSKTSGKRFLMMDAPTRKADLEFVISLIAEGTISPVVDKVYDFDDLPKAMAYLGSRRARGKIVVRVA